MFKKAAVELLILKKDDFNRVLKVTMKKQWDEISAAMKRFPYFDDWDDGGVRECCMLSDTAAFMAQELVLGDSVGKSASAHFVLQGACCTIQGLKVERRGSKHKLLPSDTPLGPGIESIFMQTSCTIKGGCFNLGESLDGKTVVADTDTLLLRIPLYVLRQHNTANIWNRLQNYLESRSISEKELFQRFLESRRWVAYRKDLFEKLRNPNTLNYTTIHDVPYYWRVMEGEAPVVDDEPRLYRKNERRYKKKKFGSRKHEV